MYSGLEIQTAMRFYWLKQIYIALGGKCDSIIQNINMYPLWASNSNCKNLTSGIFTDKYNDLGTKILTIVLSILVENWKIKW